jgi:hypothetical protein
MKMSSRHLGSRMRLRKRCALAALKFEAKMRVAAKAACGLHVSGFVRKRTSSQLLSAGTALKTFGTLPARKCARYLPTSV